jgi:putative membrane protein
VPFGFPYRGGDGGIWVGMILSWIFWILVVALVVVLLVRLLRSHDSGWRGPMSGPMSGPLGGPDSPEEILHRRLANGEIDVDEYEKRMTALRAQRPPPR